MLNGKKVEIKTSETYDTVPMDRYTVQISDVNEVMQLNKWKGVEEPVLNFEFTILDEKDMDLSEGGVGSTRGNRLWHRIRPVLNQKSWLNKLIKAVYGRELSDDEAARFDADAIVGSQVDVMVEHNPSKDGSKVFANIISYSKTVKKLVPVDRTEKSVAVTPATAPVDDEADSLIAELSEESVEDEMTDEELELKILMAKKKAASARAAKKA